MGFSHYYMCEQYERRLTVRFVERMALGTNYPLVVQRARELAGRAVMEGRKSSPTLVVDATGLGAPVVDALRDTDIKGEIVAVTMTGGEAATRWSGGWNVPKHDLIVGLKMMFDTGELEIAADLSLWRELVGELMQMGQNYRAQSGLTTW